MMRSINFTLTGISPMLHHNAEDLANPRSTAYKRMQELHAQKKKAKKDQSLVDKINDELARIEWTYGMYWDEHLGVVIPARCLRKSIIEAAKATKNGKDIERNVLISKPNFKLLYRGHKDIKSREDLWDRSVYTDIRLVRIGRALIPRCRPIFQEWSCEAFLLFNEGGISKEALVEFVKFSGIASGLGDGRTIGFGRYELTAVEGVKIEPEQMAAK